VVGRHAAPSSPGARRWAVASVAALALVGVGGGYALGRHPSPTTTTTASSTTASSTTASTVSTTRLTSAAPPSTIILSAGGDTALGYTPTLPADPTAYLAPIKSAVRADVVFANLEGTMTNRGVSKCGASSSECYAFRVPPSFAQAYRATGFTVLNSANNHSYDFGAQGQADTSAALRTVGIVQAGLPGQIGLVHVHGVSVAFVDVAPYALTNDMLNAAQVAQLIAQARREARIVVVYMHSGAEGTSADHVTRATEYYYGENRGDPYAFAHRAIDEGADLVIGSGPHVLRGMQWYKGRLIAYSLGDFANYEAFASVGDLAMSAVLHVTMNARGVIEAASVVPITIHSGGQAFVDPTHAAWGFMNQLSREDFAASAAVIGALGRITIPRGA
jgi:poly-gamma-glutamate capsule biosynthesis protein CapA/YwtB (metallophosphatase superfamily)